MLAALILCVGIQDSESTKPRLIKIPEFGMVQLSQDQKSIAVNMKVMRTVSERVPYTYHVTVMTTVKDDDGNEKQVPRVEQKQGVRTVSRTVAEAGKNLFKSEEVELLDLEGKKLTGAALKNLSSKKLVPAVILRKGRKLDPFFVKALKESTVVVVLPKPKPTRRPAARPPGLRRPAAKPSK